MLKVMSLQWYIITQSPESIRVHSLCCTCKGFGQMYNDMYLSNGIIQCYFFIALTTLSVPSFYLTPLYPTSKDHWSLCYFSSLTFVNAIDYPLNAIHFPLRITCVYLTILMCFHFYLVQNKIKFLVRSLLWTICHLEVCCLISQGFWYFPAIFLLFISNLIPWLCEADIVFYGPECVLSWWLFHGAWKEYVICCFWMKPFTDGHYL